MNIETQRLAMLEEIIREMDLQEDEDFNFCPIQSADWDKEDPDDDFYMIAYIHTHTPKPTKA